MNDWQIAQKAEKTMKPIEQIAEELGLLREELIFMGKNVLKVDAAQVLSRLKTPQAKYIDITAINPTPFGEGKTTTAIALVDGLKKKGKKPIGTLRQPSSGPTFNIKGSAAGGGYSQCLPRNSLSLGLTGDINAITNAHNLATNALFARLLHEKKLTHDQLNSLGLQRLDIDEKRIQMHWSIDFCAQALRKVILNPELFHPEVSSGFDISASSEVMAIFSIAKDLKDLRERMGKIVVAYDKQGKEITTKDLEVDGAMSALLVEALNPNLLQTMEQNPLFIHGGAFANIALGQSSLIADQLAIRLGDFLITESGFGADIGFEKFWNLKCRLSGLVPSCVVIVATLRALKMHGGGPVISSRSLDKVYEKENLALVEKGFENLQAHIEIVQKSKTPVVICLNHFFSDTSREIELLRHLVEKTGAYFAPSYHFEKGGEGARELAEVVLQASQEKSKFEFLYPENLPFRQRIEKIAKEVYGASSVLFQEKALEKLLQFEKDPSFSQMGICMAKTHLSLSHDPEKKGRPKNWTLPIHDILVYKGAGWIVPLTSNLSLMPGTSSNPAFRHIDIDLVSGKVTGLQ